jgi:hypothetical protein
MSKWECDGVRFKVGDKVKIVRKVETHDKNGMGLGREWKNCWNPAMDGLIGESGKIGNITDQGAWVDDVSYYWPLSSLELQCKTPAEKLDKKMAKAVALGEKLERLNNEIKKLRRKLA